MQWSAGARRHHSDRTINCPPHSWHLLTKQRRSRDTPLPYQSHVTNGAAGSPSHAHVWRLPAPLSAPVIGCRQRGTVESGRAVWPLPRRFGAQISTLATFETKAPGRAGPARRLAAQTARPAFRARLLAGWMYATACAGRGNLPLSDGPRVWRAGYTCTKFKYISQSHLRPHHYHASAPHKH
jgi:hypothetical protein